MTPMDVFLTELKKTNVAFTLVPGGEEECRFDWFDSVIYLGKDLSPVVLGIVGLHELGHMVTSDFYPKELRLLMNPIMLWCLELSAWDWAEKKMPPGYEKEFEEIKTFGLSSYIR